MVEYQITQLTNNNFVDIVPQMSFPQIIDNKVVWGFDDGNGSEIFFYDGNTITELTNNDVFDSFPQISGNNLVWYRSSNNPFLDLENGGEIIFYDGNTTTQIGSSNASAFPVISGNNVVWGDDFNNGGAILLYDGNTTTQLTDSGFLFGGVPNIISENKVAWTDLESGEIFFYDGDSTTQLTNNETDDFAARISGDNIVWQASDGNDLEIFFYDGNSITQLTENEINDENPAISGNNITWEANGDIFLATPLTITNPALTANLQLDDNLISSEFYLGGDGLNLGAEFQEIAVDSFL